MSQEIDRATSHEHTAASHKVTNDDEHSTRTVYTCACGAFKVIEQLPSGCWRMGEWTHYESTRAG